MNVSKYESEYVSSIKVQNLVLSFLLGEKDWKNSRSWCLKAITQDFKYHFPFPNNERHSANVFHGEIVGSIKGSEQMKKLGYNPTHCYERFVFTKVISSISNPFYVLADNLVSDGSVFINEKTNFKVTDNDWEGNRVFSDGTNIKKALGKLECEVFFSDGGKFSGTLKSVEPYGNLYPVAASSTIDKNVFYSGEYTKDGRTEKWIKGEPLSFLHERIINIYDADLVSSIENGSMSEDDAKAEQNNRKIREGSLATFKKLWNCSEILFGGRFDGTADGDKTLNLLFGLDHTYFDGEVLLTLNNNGEAVLVVHAGPTKKAINEGRGRALQVNSLCEELFSNQIKDGKWFIDGDKIVITGKDKEKKSELIINQGGQTLKYNGPMTSTLKIVKKR